MKFEAAEAGYKALYAKMVVLPSWQARSTAAAKKIIANRARYENDLGVPWWFVGILHYRESAMDFGTYLGNGQSLKRETTIVPKGRGPFASFEAGVVDALTIQGYANQADWSDARVLHRFEAFNGFGYVGHDINSPYVWSGSNLYSSGKYIADGVWSASKVDEQLGCAVIFKTLMGLIMNQVIGAVTAPSTSPQAPVPINTVTTSHGQMFVQHLLTFVGAVLVAIGATHAATTYDAMVNSQVFGGVIVAGAGYLLSAVGINDTNANTRALLDSVVVKLTTMVEKPKVITVATEGDGV